MSQITSKTYFELLISYLPGFELAYRALPDETKGYWYQRACMDSMTIHYVLAGGNAVRTTICFNFFNKHFLPDLKISDEYTVDFWIFMACIKVFCFSWHTR